MTRRAKVQMCGAYIAVYDVESNRDLFTVPLRGAWLARAVAEAAARGYELVNVRHGKVEL